MFTLSGGKMTVDLVTRKEVCDEAEGEFLECLLPPTQICFMVALPLKNLHCFPVGPQTGVRNSLLSTS
jgi:hypothetical protein